MIASDQNKL